MSAELDTSEFDAAMVAIENRIDPEISAALDRVVAWGVRQLNDTSAFENRTGRLRGSFSQYAAQSLRAPDGERVIGTDVPYGFFLEFGTKTAKSRAAADHMGAGFRASRGVKRVAGQWRIEPRLFVSSLSESIGVVLREEINNAMVRAIGRR